MSLALAVSVTAPETVLPAVGPVTLTVGACVSATVFFTVKVRAAEVVTLPAASLALAVTVCAPLLRVFVFKLTL